MAIAFNAESHGETNTATTSLSHTPAGSDRVMIVATVGRNAYASSCVFNTSESLTTLYSYDNGIYYMRFFGLAAPTATTANVVTTWGQNIGNYQSATVVTFTGVEQGTYLDATGTAGNSGTGFNMSISMSTTSDQCWVVSTGNGPSGISMLGTSFTAIWQAATSNNVGGYGGPNSVGGGTVTYQGSNGVPKVGASIAIVPVATSFIKTVDGLAKASVKTVDGLAIASVKTINGLA